MLCRFLGFIAWLTLSFALPATAEQQQSPADFVRTLVDAPAAEMDFARAKLAVDRVADPTIDEAAALAELDRMTATVEKMLRTLPPDEQLGQSVKAVLAMHRTGVPDEEETTEDLDRSVRQLGFKSYRAFFTQCLQMSVEETAQGYELTPYERVNSRGTEGAVPADTTLSSTKAVDDLGRAVRECTSYCR